MFKSLRSLLLGSVVALVASSPVLSVQAQQPEEATTRPAFWLRELGPYWKYVPGSEYPGAQGSLSVVNQVMTLDYNFMNGGGYVGAFIWRPINQEFKEFTFRYKATTNVPVVVRLWDAQGEVFQYVKSYIQSPEWVDYKVNVNFSTMNYIEGSKDPNDPRLNGVVDFPIKAVLFGVNKSEPISNYKGSAQITEIGLPE